MKKQYQVRIDPTLLIKYDLSWEEVMQAVKANNLNVGGGSINRSGDMLLLHGVGRTNTIEQIEGIVVAAKEGVPIHVSDVAEVTIGHEIRRGVVTANGQGEVVLGLGFMLMGENSYAVTSRPGQEARRSQNAVAGRRALEDRVQPDRPGRPGYRNGAPQPARRRPYL